MIQYPFAFITSACIAVSFRAPRQAIPWVGLSGLVAWAGYDITLRLGGPAGFAVFIGAISLGTLAEWLARRLRQPVILFVIPGLFPLVPGIIAYRGMLLFSQERLQEGASQLFRALFFAGTLAGGLAVPPALFRRRRP